MNRMNSVRTEIVILLTVIKLVETTNIKWEDRIKPTILKGFSMCILKTCINIIIPDTRDQSM